MFRLLTELKKGIFHTGWVVSALVVCHVSPRLGHLFHRESLSAFPLPACFLPGPHQSLRDSKLGKELKEMWCFFSLLFYFVLLFLIFH